MSIVGDETQVGLELSSLFLKTMSDMGFESTRCSSNSDANSLKDSPSASRELTDASDGSPSVDSKSWTDHSDDTEGNSEACSVISARPAWSQLMPSSLKARCSGGVLQTHRSWVNGQGARKPRQTDHLPIEALEKLKDVNTELRYEHWPDVERRWRDGLCAEKKQEDSRQRPVNGSKSPTVTEGPLANCLPLKELEILRSGNAELRHTKWTEIDSEWIATVCAEKKHEDALALQRSVESMHSAELNSRSSLERLEALDDRLNRFPVESRWSHEYYYSSQILLH